MICRKAYSAVKKGEQIDNLVALLDGLSAVLSHVGDKNQPCSKLLSSLKREIKSMNKTFYKTAKVYFKRGFPVPDYDLKRALKHVPAIIYANDTICSKLVKGEHDKVKSMCSAMESYPGYIFGEFSALSDSQFYDLVFGYYPKFYDEDFMGEMKSLFE